STCHTRPSTRPLPLKMEHQPITSVVPGPSSPPTPGDEVIQMFCISEPNVNRDGDAIMASNLNGVEHDSVTNGRQRRRAKVQLAGIYAAIFLAGWNDGKPVCNRAVQQNQKIDLFFTSFLVVE
ncbi:unnamed protein product, partial [Mycena citricolor]